MGQLTAEQRVFVVKNWFVTKSLEQVRQLFRERFPDREPTTRMAIWKNVKKYTAYGTSLNRTSGHSGRPKTGRSQENINRVHELLVDNPRGVSSRRNGLEISQSSFVRIVKYDLKWHPYEMRVRHQLKPTDFDRRISEWIIEKCRDRRFLANLIIGDEAGFAINGKVNSQNVREYAPHGERPEINYAVNESRERCTVWVGLCGNGTLLGPFFFDGYVNSANYLHMLKEELFPQLTDKFGNQFNNDHFSRLWWAQDGAPPHRPNDVREWLMEFFHHHVIALRHDIRNPPKQGCEYPVFPLNT